MIKCNVTNVAITLTETETLTAGRVGLECQFTFSSEWDGLAITAYFLGSTTKAVVVSGDTVAVPAESMAEPGYKLYVGVVGKNAQGNIVIPTLWASAGKIKRSPGEEEEATPSPDVVAQIQLMAINAVNTANAAMQVITDHYEEIEEVGTEQVAAVNSAGTTQTGNVNTAGADQVAAVQAKGEEVLDSIPEDYTALSDDVDDLKSAFELIDYGESVFTVTAGISHSSQANEADIKIPSGSNLVVSIKTENADSLQRVQVYVFYTDNTSSRLYDGSSKYAFDNVFTAEKETKRVGVYINGEYILQNDTVTLQVYGGTFEKTPIYLNENLTKSFNYILAPAWVNKTIESGSGEQAESSTRISMQNKSVAISDGYYIISTNGLQVNWFAYNNNTKVRNGDYWNGNQHCYVRVSKGESINIVARKEDNSNIRPDSIVPDIVFRADDINDFENLLSFNKITSGFLNTYGTISIPSKNGNECTSDFISVSENDQYIFKYEADVLSGSSTWAAYVYYNSNKQMIGARTTVFENATGNVQLAAILTAPVGAAYIRITARLFNHGIFALLHEKRKGFTLSFEDTMALKNINPMYYEALENDTIKGINHRGYSHFAPENTIPAFVLSRRNGFKYVESDVQLTSDGVPMMLHDYTINRTGRNENGSTISEVIKLCDITYSQSQDYDFGIWYGSAYAGTKLPTFAEFLQACKKLSLHPFVEIKRGRGSDDVNFTEEEIHGIVDVARRSGMISKVTWTSFKPLYLDYISDYEPNSELGLIVTETDSSAVQKVLAYKQAGHDAYILTSSISNDLIAQCASLGIPVFVWTLNTKEEMLNLDQYISGVISDELNAPFVFYEAANQF